MTRFTLVCAALSIAACTEQPETGPLPPDPPEQECSSAVLTPITTTHEHILSVAHLDILRGHMEGIDVGRIVLLPFFENFREQNGLQLKAAQADPRFVSFCTVDPHDSGASQMIRDHVAAGGAGVKLFSGHGNFHSPASIVSPNAWVMYDTIEKLGVPLLMHVNGGLYENELRQVLEAFPNMRVSCPHYCLFAGRIHRLHALLATYPNLYSDVSFGSFHIAVAGIANVNAFAPQIRAVVRHYPDRFLFGTDLPVGESAGWKENGEMLTHAYRNMLEKQSYVFAERQYRGLGLDKCTLEKIYRTNPESFLTRRPPP